MKFFLICLALIHTSIQGENFKQHSSNTKMAKRCLLEKFPTELYFGKYFLDPFNDLKITEKTWEQRINFPCFYERESLKNQFQVDVKLWWNTIFKKADLLSGFPHVGEKKLQPKHLKKIELTQIFLKRLFILFAYAPLSYVFNNNASALPKSDPLYEPLKPFPFPLASALSHGGRVLIILKNIKDKDFFNLLLGGNEDTESISFLRSFASHGVYKESGKIFEDKIFMGLLDALSLDHHGINIPFGGVGNLNELGYFIGPEGQSYNNEKDSSIDKYQLGHIFIGRDRFSDMSTLLIGVESTQPGGISPFKTGGKHHGITSGLEDQTLNRSVSGGQKWLPLIGSLAPASYGGLIIVITPEKLILLKDVWQKLLSIPDNQLGEIFLSLLAMNSTEAKKYISDIISENHQ